jgi:hypothetical protein
MEFLVWQTLQHIVCGKEADKGSKGYFSIVTEN